MKYTVSLSLETADRVYADKRVLATHPSEVSWHIALKVLGLLLFAEYSPQVEEGVGWHYKPDLVTLGERGEVLLWVDCGNIAVRKIDRVAHWLGSPGRFFVLERDRREGESLARAVSQKVRHPERVTVHYFDEGVVDALAAHLDSTNDVRAHRGDRRLALSVANRRGELRTVTEVHTASPDP